MQINTVELAAQYGVLGSLLFAVMFWLLKYFLPEQLRQHRAELESIISAHDRNTGRLVNAVERNTRVVQFNSQALLVQSLIRGGLDRRDAEQIADSIRLSTLNGLDFGGEPVSR
jgi:hypothetical protein